MQPSHHSIPFNILMYYAISTFLHCLRADVSLRYGSLLFRITKLQLSFRYRCVELWTLFSPICFINIKPPGSISTRRPTEQVGL